MSSATISVDKRVGLKVYCLLVQASASLHRSKLGWDPVNGFGDLRRFYNGKRMQLMQDTLTELTSMSAGVSIDIDLIRNRLNSSAIDRSILVRTLLSALSRLKSRFTLMQDEVAYLASCLTLFVDILENAVPPSIETDRMYKFKLALATQILGVRFWHMPQFSMVSKVEVVSPPPIGKKYSVEEILTQV